MKLTYHVTLNLHGDSARSLGTDAHRIAQDIRALKLKIMTSCLFHDRNEPSFPDKVKDNVNFCVETMKTLSEIEKEFNQVADAYASLIGI